MTSFQFLLLLIALGILYLFFKQLFSGDHPKRGVDFEAKVSNEQIGAITEPKKTFSTPTVPPTRMDQLFIMADEAIENEDYEEAKKALGSALILEKDNSDALQKIGYVYLQTHAYEDAKQTFLALVALDEKNDMAQVSLANVYHKLGEEQNAEKHHEQAIMIDPDYAPHHFNYANTLYDLERYKEALVGYKKAYELDPSLEVAKEMITKLGEKNE